MMAVAAARDPYAYPEAGEPWQVCKVYYDVAFNRSRLEAFDSALRANGLVSPFESWLSRDSQAIQACARIEVADFFAQRDAALRAHATQIDPDGFFAMPRDLEAEVCRKNLHAGANHCWRSAVQERDLFERIPGVEVV